MDNLKKSQRNIQRNVSVFDLEHGKTQPQALELEEAILGALMIDNEALNTVIDIISSHSFYKEAHKEIFRAISNLFASSQPVDLLTVSNELKRNGQLDMIGGDYYLSQLTQKVASSAHIETHARIVVQKHIQRELIKVSSKILKDAYDDTIDVLELLDRAESNLFEIADGNIKKNYDSAQSLIAEAITKIEDIAKRQGMSGVPSGFSKLDSVTSGWQNSDLIIIAARPGMGKTAFALSMARNIAVDHEIPVGIFSLEMSSVQLITRLISSETELPSEKLRKGDIQDHEWNQLHSKISGLEKAKLYIDDTPSLSVFDLRAKCRRLKSKYDIGVIIVDYLQLMTSGVDKKSGNREQEISTISRSLKSIAKELDIPIIALSQLNRSVETRGGSKRPLLADLRESGAIEQDADIVSFIYRPEYYNQEVWDDGSEDPTEGQAEIIIAKHRNGGLDNIRLKFVARLAKFENISNNNFSGEIESSMNENTKNETPF